MIFFPSLFGSCKKTEFQKVNYPNWVITWVRIFKNGIHLPMIKLFIVVSWISIQVPDFTY